MRLVDIDAVLDLFGIGDSDIYAKGTINDAVYDGTLKIYTQPKDGGWIPCSERLPDYDVEVLATTEWGGVTIAERNEPRTGEKDYWWFMAEGNMNVDKGDIIAWMNLPEPYKEEGDGNTD